MRIRSLVRAVVRFAVESMNVIIITLDDVGLGSLESKGEDEMPERNKIC